MRHGTRLGIAFVVLFCPAVFAQTAENSSLPQVQANDNGTPGGQLKSGVLSLRLELLAGVWYPEEEGGGHRDVYAFAEEGHAAQSPGPLLRVPQGTEIHIAIHNTLPLEVKIYGLHRHPGDPKDAVKLAPGETRELQFPAGEPGTYLYWATTSDKSIEHRDGAETLLSGAFIVDAPGGKPDDRIFVIGTWRKVLAADGSWEEIPSINGKAWPYTERLTYKIGQTIRWRVLNATLFQHAMHLHGFHFKVDGVGDREHYERYPEEQRRLAVTEPIPVGHVFEMSWTPDRTGNWLFHCHMLAHMLPSDALHPVGDQPAGDPPAHDHSAGMGGLVIGITVLGDAKPAPASVTASIARKLQLAISENPGMSPLYQLQVNDPKAPTVREKDKPTALLGPPIFLTRGETTEIEVKNLTTNPTSIHWHGMELESYYDGVPGWTGSGQQTTPAIAPGTSFVARMTPPHAGTYIYHTHWHDEMQLLNGLYGPLIVLEPGQKFDPELDRIIVFSEGRYLPFGYLLLVNGHPQPEPLELHAGTRYRLRFINITDEAEDLRVRLTNKSVPEQWKIIARDGVDLPPAQLRTSAAEMEITVGETYDVEYQADAPGLANLMIWQPRFPSQVTLPLKFLAAK